MLPPLRFGEGGWGRGCIRCSTLVLLPAEDDEQMLAVVFRWERAVHHPGTYDLEVDTSRASPEACAAAIARRLDEGPPVAFAELARGWA